MRAIGENDYRRGAAERLAESRLILRAGRYGGCAYLAGRAVEAMFRAVIWKNDPEIRLGRKPLETGHDLRQLLNVIRNLGLLRRPIDVMLQVKAQRIARLWFNNMRFLSSRFVESRWRDLGEVHKRHTMKQAAEDFSRVLEVVAQCEELCQ